MRSPAIVADGRAQSSQNSFNIDKFILKPVDQQGTDTAAYQRRQIKLFGSRFCDEVIGGRHVSDGDNRVSTLSRPVEEGRALAVAEMPAAFTGRKVVR
jgi:hypothetical protein